MAFRLICERFAALALLAVAACTAHPSSESASPGESALESMDECNAFVTAYGRCLRGAGDEAVIAARLEQTRVGLAEQARGDDAARSALRRQCADNLARLKSTCP